MTEIATPALPGATTTIVQQPAPVAVPAVAPTLPGAQPAADASQSGAAPLPTAPPDAAQNAGTQDDLTKLIETPPKPNRVQARIDELTRGKREAERRAQAAEAEAAAAQRKLRELASRVDPNDPEAVNAYRIREAVAAEKIEAANEAAKNNADAASYMNQQAQAARQQAFMSNIAAASERIPGLQFAVQQFAAMPCPDAMADCLATSDRSPELVHFFTTHPQGQQVYYDLIQQSPAALGRSLAQLEARITAQPVKRISQAPAPVQTVTGAPASPVPDPAKMSFAEYEKWRMGP